jgi:hypothetical protein
MSAGMKVPSATAKLRGQRVYTSQSNGVVQEGDEILKNRIVPWWRRWVIEVPHPYHQIAEVIVIIQVLYQSAISTRFHITASGR